MRRLEGENERLCIDHERATCSTISGVNLIILDPAEVSSSGEVQLTGARAAHMMAVLKVSPGSTARVGLLDGPLGIATVRAVSGDAVDLQCEFDRERPPVPPLDLLLALPRPKVLRRLWAQLAALGVGRIMLANAERVERNYFDTHLLTEASYRPLLLEGLQQARDTRLPVVSIHRRFRVLVEDELKTMCPDGPRLVADSAALGFADSLLTGPPGDRVLIAVGPEGGWNRFELDLLAAHQFEAFSLGPRTLRSDTACVAILAVIQRCLHDRLRRRRQPDTAG